MVKLMRRYQQTLMILVTFVVIIAFAWLYNDHDFGKVGNENAGQLYGRTISRAEFGRVARKFEICQMLGMQELWQALAFTGTPKSRNDLEENFIWNSFVLRHETDALGIEPSEAEIVDAVQSIPGFMTNGVYDSSKYTQFVQQGLNPRGFTTDQLEELVADSLRLAKIKALLGATNDPAPSEVRALFDRRNQKTELSLIRLKIEDFKKEVKVSDEDLQKRFEERKDTLQHPEKRKVKFVAFTLPPATPPLAGKERVLAMQKLSDQAGNFAIAMAEKDAKLDDVAAKFAVKVQESAEFEATATPTEFSGSSKVGEAAFQLTNETPNSDALTSENGYFVLQLAGITPMKPMTFEESKKQLNDEMIDERGNEALTLKATELRNKISEAVKGGKAFAEAAKEAGANVEAFPVFSQAEPKMDAPDAREVMQRAVDLGEGELSEFTPTESGGVLVFVNKRLPVDETNFEKEKPMIAQSIDRTKKEAAFQLWLKERRAAAGLLEALPG